MPARPTGIMVFELLMRHSHSETLTNTDQRLGVISVTFTFLPKSLTAFWKFSEELNIEYGFWR